MLRPAIFSVTTDRGKSAVGEFHISFPLLLSFDHRFNAMLSQRRGSIALLRISISRLYGIPFRESSRVLRDEMVLQREFGFLSSTG